MLVPQALLLRTIQGSDEGEGQSRSSAMASWNEKKRSGVVSVGRPVNRPGYQLQGQR